jgi:hypothetical protein
LFDIYLNYVQIILVFLNDDVNYYITNLTTKTKSRTGSRSGSGSATRSAYFLLEAEAPEAEAEALKI